MSKNKHIISDLTAIEDVIARNLLVWIGEVGFLAFTVLLKCRFIKL